jgi:hypothetical protein
VDSTINRAHQHAAGARRHPDQQLEPPGPEPADHGLGRSRGGFTTKIHLACEQGRKPLALVFTAGQRADSPQFTTVLAQIRVPRPGPGRPRSRPERVLADKAYSSRANRAYLRRRAITATIPVKADQAANRARRAHTAGAHRRSTPTPTATATPWNAASTCSNTTERSPPAMTNSWCATPRPCTSPRSTSGCAPWPAPLPKHGGLSDLRCNWSDTPSLLGGRSSHDQHDRARARQD